MKGAASCCGILTLQVGAAILSVLLLTLTGLILVVNGFDYYNDLESGVPVNLIVLVVFLLLLIITGLCMFFAAYEERKTWALVATVLMVIVLLLWLILTALTMTNNSTTLKQLCIHERCPESVWLVNLRYRGTWRECRVTADWSRPHTVGGEDRVSHKVPKSSTTTTTTPASTTFKWPFNQWKEIIGNSTEAPTSLPPKWPFQDWQHAQETSSHSPNYKRSVDRASLLALSETNNQGIPVEPTYEMGLPLVGAVVVFIAILIFFVFSAYTMWSYYKELSRWIPVKEQPMRYT